MGYHVSALESLLQLLQSLGPEAAEKSGWESPSGASVKRSVAVVLPIATGEVVRVDWHQTTVQMDRDRAAAGIATIGVGLITDVEQAETIVASGDADMVALARGMLYDPRWAWHAAAALGASVRAPEQYWRCAPREAGKVFGDVKIGQR